jgi:uncharacterized protein (DUF488 family)
MTVWSVGHSTRSTEALIGLLRAHRIATVVDVRTAPRSRRHPHFDKDALADSLPAAAIAYAHMPGLGGLRTPGADSPNTGWSTDGFRGYADYMQTDEFASHVWALVTLAGGTRLAMMCAEASPAQCHRSLLADALVVRGVDVLHITGDDRPTPHELTPWAHRHGLRLTYPPRQGELFRR